ncbi:MAG: carboxypeptidase regulatory-like domain-containing protein [Proteobacteria bacterium]|nr:carboxypeptidase regulatory-like domain-containing protein [Pseudomonadota bacterium]
MRPARARQLRAWAAERPCCRDSAAVRLALLAPTFALCLFGCAAVDDGAAIDAPRVCRTLDGCPGDLICDLSLQRCVRRAAGTVDLELRPPTNDRGWVAQEFLGALPGAAQELELVLDAAVLWRGRVVASDDPETPLPADVTVWRKSRIAGRPVVQLEASTIVEGGEGDLGEHSGGGATAAGSFLFLLNRGQSYAGVAVPRSPVDHSDACVGSADRDCPPSFPPVFEPAVSLTDHLQRDLYLDGRDRSIVMIGRVLDASGTPLAFSVDLRAVGEGQAARLRSTIGRTCSKAQPSRCRCAPIERCLGAFALALPRGIERYALRLAADASTSGEAAAQQLPTVECSGALLGLAALDGAGGLQPVVLPSPLILPPFPAADGYTLQVVGDDGGPVASAEVSLASDDFTALEAPPELGRCRAHHRQAAVTDAEGRATLLLLPGDNAARSYEITVIAPARSRWASLRRGGIAVAPGGRPLEPLRLLERLRIVGRVRGPGGEIVAGALIEAAPVTPSKAAVTAAVQGSASALSGADGTFALWVDPGSYDLTVRPPATVSLAATTQLDLDLSEPRDALDLRLPEAALLHGRVVDATGVGASGCTVQAFESVARQGEDARPPLALPRATAVTDSDGRFSLRLARPES